MAKQLVEVDVPEGFEAVGHRLPLAGDFYINSKGEVVQSPEAWNGCNGPRLVLRPEWTWPAWLKAPWIAMDSKGGWCAYQDEPRIIEGSDCWGPQLGDWSDLLPGIFDFTPPPVTDWRQSKRRNPNL
jgi:hypothetical protein